MADKNKTTYGILAIIFGALGIHKFYVGDTKHGIIMLLISLCTFFIAAWIMWILGAISGIKALTGDEKTFHQNYVVEKKWI